MATSFQPTFSTTGREADETLVSRVAERDCDAFALLHARHEQLAHRVARVALGAAGREHVDDVVQESFLAVWRRSQRFDAHRGNFRSWLAGIVRNRAIDALRAAQAEHGRRSRAEQLSLTRTEFEPTALHLEFRERQRDIREAVEGLPREQYRVLDLAYYVGLPQSAISDLLSCPLGTVKSRSRLGLARLRDTMEDQT